jgi:PAS domain S-box-containing protein
MPAKKRSSAGPRKRPAAAPFLATTDAILESISDGVFTVDRNWCITSFNRAAEAVTGVSRAEALGRPCAEVFKASMCEAECALRKTLATGLPIVNRSAFIVNAAGRRIPISVSTAMLKDAGGRIVGGAETFRDLSLVEELRKELSGRFEIGDMVSRSPSMRRLFDILPQLAVSESTVLIQGETGTGKELAARAIHVLSPRSKRPFVAINCGALPDTLLESELFGYKAGAFTGANRDKPGLLARAEGGTLFLDEIGEISPALQVRLLRVLQDRTYEPLGGSAMMKANVRVMAATHRDLAALVRKGSFRQDLFYRINVVQVEIPPLRRRKEDIPLLVDHFIGRFNRLQGRTVSEAVPEVMALLLAHDYPGNVRELENLIEHAFVLCGNGPIEPRHLPVEFTGGGAAVTSPGVSDLREGLRAAEIQIIREAMVRNRNNRLAAARELGLHKSTLFRKIKALGIDLPAEDGRSRSGRPPLHP